MQVDEFVTVHGGEGDDARQEENTSTSTSWTPSSPYPNALDKVSSDEEPMEMVEAVLVTERTAHEMIRSSRTSTMVSWHKESSSM